MIGLHARRACQAQREERLLDFDEFCEAQAVRIKVRHIRPNRHYKDDSEGTLRVLASYDIERRGYTTGASGSTSHHPPRAGEAGTDGSY